MRRTSAIKLRQPTLTHQQNVLVHALWEGAIEIIYRVFWSRPRPRFPLALDATEMDLLHNLHTILELTSYMLSANISVQYSDTQLGYRRLDTLGYYLAIYWDYYLVLRKSQSLDATGEILTVTSSLKGIIQHIVGFVAQFPPVQAIIHFALECCPIWTTIPTDPSESHPTFLFQDKKAAMLYGFAVLLKNLLSTDNSDSSYASAVSSARLLTRLCWIAIDIPVPLTAPSGLSLTRSLLWSGIFIKHCEFPAGIPELFKAD